jgi:hypothetical protein
VGQIQFLGEDDASNSTIFGSIVNQIKDASNGSEDGRMSFNIISAGSDRTFLNLTHDGTQAEVVVNEDSRDIDFRVESDASANAFFVEGSSGNVGIGCVPNSIQSNFDTLQIGGNLTLNVDSTGANAGVYMGNNVYRDSTNSRWEYIYTDEASQYYQANGNHVWRYAASGTADTAITWSEAMRIDTSGNLLVGTTDSDLTNNSGTATGANLKSNGLISSATNSTSSLELNRLSSDGNIANFRRSGALVGSIACNGGAISIGSDDVGVYFDASSDRILPVNVSTNSVRNDAIDIGSSSHRFKDLYLSGGVYLGGTGSANKLEDYEEGTFDVALDSGHSGSITLNSSYKTGRYIKIGNTVTFTLHVRISAVSAPSGTLGLTGLPFASPNDHDYRFTFGPCVFFSFTGMTDGDYPVAYLSHNSSTLLFALTNTNSIQNFPANRLTAGSEWYVTGTYQTA